MLLITAFVVSNLSKLFVHKFLLYVSVYGFVDFVYVSYVNDVRHFVDISSSICIYQYKLCFALCMYE